MYAAIGAHAILQVQRLGSVVVETQHLVHKLGQEIQLLGGGAQQDPAARAAVASNQEIQSMRRIGSSLIPSTSMF